MRVLKRLLVAAIPVAGPSWFDRDTVEGVATVGVATADGLASWDTRGFGKSQRRGGTLAAASQEGVWRPQITDDVSVVVDGISQPLFGAETGDSGLTAVKHRLSATQSLLLELLDVEWKRPILADFGVAPHQSQTAFQAALRQAFLTDGPQARIQGHRPKPYSADSVNGCKIDEV